MKISELYNPNKGSILDFIIKSSKNIDDSRKLYTDLNNKHIFQDLFEKDIFNIQKISFYNKLSINPFLEHVPPPRSSEPPDPITMEAAMQLFENAGSPIAYLQIIHDLLKREVFGKNEGGELALACKEILRDYAKLFSFVDQNIREIEEKDRSLFLALKLQFANLPAPAPREQFPNLHLSEREKLEILIAKAEDSKARRFFEEQLALPEAKIFIPHFYHATKSEHAQKIIESGKILVQHQGEGGLPGAWVAGQPELAFGPYVLALNQRVTELDPIPLEADATRFWKGLRTAIPLTSTFGSTFGFLAIPKGPNKRAEKLKLKELLAKGGLSHVAVHSVKRLQSINELVRKTLGRPGLPDGWWAPQNPFYFQHQEELLKKAGELAHELGKDSCLANLSHPKPTLATVSNVLQKLALPFYKEPMPLAPSYLPKGSAKRVALRIKHNYPYHLALVSRKTETARSTHDTMHAARVALWSQLLRLLYQDLGSKELPNPLLLALTAGLHDAAREDEEIDRWDEESAQIVKTLLSCSECSQEEVALAYQAIAEKDPENGDFSHDFQRIIHDADCLDIIRLCGRFGFRKEELQIYKLTPPEKRAYLDKLIDEIAAFISLTESRALRIRFEHTSKDFYGDLIKLIVSEHREQFPLLAERCVHLYF